MPVAAADAIAVTRRSRRTARQTQRRRATRWSTVCTTCSSGIKRPPNNERGRRSAIPAPTMGATTIAPTCRKSGPATSTPRRRPSRRAPGTSAAERARRRSAARQTHPTPQGASRSAERQTRGRVGPDPGTPGSPEADGRPDTRRYRPPVIQAPETQRARAGWGIPHGRRDPRRLCHIPRNPCHQDRVDGGQRRQRAALPSHHICPPQPRRHEVSRPPIAITAGSSGATARSGRASTTSRSSPATRNPIRCDHRASSALSCEATSALRRPPRDGESLAAGPRDLPRPGRTPERPARAREADAARRAPSPPAAVSRD